jgi:hypothetical protein
MMLAIKNIIGRIYQDTGIRVIQANLTAPTPSLPYAVYNITSPYIKGVGSEDINTHDDGTGLYLKRFEEYQVTLSLNLYASDTETAIDLATQVRKWFSFVGEDFIRGQNVTVISTGNVENRTTFIVDSYEYKYGFDVQLRMSEETMKELEYYFE